MLTQPGQLYPNAKERVENKKKRREFLNKVHKLEKQRIQLLESKKQKDSLIVLSTQGLEANKSSNIDVQIRTASSLSNPGSDTELEPKITNATNEFKLDTSGCEDIKVKQINPTVSQNVAMIRNSNVPNGVCQIEMENHISVDPKIINYLTDESTTNVHSSLYPSA